VVFFPGQAGRILGHKLAGAGIFGNLFFAWETMPGELPAGLGREKLV
jgi:hypothetical protein